MTNIQRLTLLVLLALCFALASCGRKTEYDAVIRQDTGMAEETPAPLRLTTVAPETADPDAVLTVIVSPAGTYHPDPECGYAKRILPENRLTVTGTAEELFLKGYVPCSHCAAEYKALYPEKMSPALSETTPPLGGDAGTEKTAVVIRNSAVSSCVSAAEACGTDVSVAVRNNGIVREKGEIQNHFGFILAAEKETINGEMRRILCKATL